MADTASLPIMRWIRLPLAIAVGVLMGLGAAPYDLWYLAFAGYIAAFVLFLMAPGGILAAGTGWGVGLGYFGFSLGWIVEPFQVDAATTGWMAPFALFGMAAGLALFWALAFWGANHARNRALWALVICWSAAELARAFVFTGFPWALVSYLWAPVPPIQWVSLIGPHGLTFMTLAIAALFASALSHRGGPTLLPAVLGGTAFLALWGGGVALIPPMQDVTGRPIVRLIQPNAEQREKWDPALMPMFFERQLALTAAPSEARPDLIVWPETALPTLLNNAQPAMAEISLAAGNSPVIFGVQRMTATGYRNSLALIGPDGALETIYDKHHLVPFGEYMPAAAVFERWNIAGLAQRAAGGYEPGEGPALLDLGVLGQAIPLICYEAVFPQDVHRAPKGADLLLQITNDAWFGKWSGPYQHLAQARIRAIEQGLPMLRSANTGVSAVIDGAGRILAKLPLGEAGHLDAEVPPPLRTTAYSRTGDLPVFVLLFVAALGVFVRNRSKSD